MTPWRGLSVVLLGFVLASCVPPGGRFGGRDWELLGEQVVDFRVERDRINVGRRENRFSALRIAVKGAPLEMRDMVVIFADGTKFSPNLRARFQENSWSRDIDLPGERRALRSIEFTYRSIDRREGRATVMLYGR